MKNEWLKIPNCDILFVFTLYSMSTLSSSSLSGTSSSALLIGSWLVMTSWRKQTYFRTVYQNLRLFLWMCEPRNVCFLYTLEICLLITLHSSCFQSLELNQNAQCDTFRVSGCEQPGYIYILPRVLKFTEWSSQCHGNSVWNQMTLHYNVASSSFVNGNGHFLTKNTTYSLEFLIRGTKTKSSKNGWNVRPWWSATFVPEYLCY